MSFDSRVLDIICRDGKGIGGIDEWQIASSIYPWDAPGMQQKHGAWIRAVIQAGRRLEKRGLVGSYIVSHGLLGYNAHQSRVWFARKESPSSVYPRK